MTGDLAHPPMPVQSRWSERQLCHIPSFGIPWPMLVSHDAQALRNHAGQDLETLYKRHGVSACEALAILEDRDYRLIQVDESTKILKALIEAFEKGPQNS